jgi:hypothetical protein
LHDENGDGGRIMHVVTDYGKLVQLLTSAGSAIRRRASVIARLFAETVEELS